MYCHNCRREIDKTVKFCPYCGSEQKNLSQPGNQVGGHGGGRSPWLRSVLIGLSVVCLVVVSLLMVGGMSDGDEDTPSQVTEQVSAESQIPADGWHSIDGELYYTRDGQMYVDLQEIDGELYYFDEDGILVVDRDVEYGDIILHSDRYGHIEGMTIQELFGTWAEEDYHFGNGGSGAILELSTEVEDCDSFRFCLEANGMYGAKVNGKWKIHIRHNGKWEFVQDINYTEPEGYFDIHFENPKSFDAITAYPTVQGNASYSPLFYLQNVHCLF